MPKMTPLQGLSTASTRDLLRKHFNLPALWPRGFLQRRLGERPSLQLPRLMRFRDLEDESAVSTDSRACVGDITTHHLPQLHALLPEPIWLHPEQIGV